MDGSWAEMPETSGGRRRLGVALWVISCLLLVGACVAFLDRPVSTWSHDVLHRPGIAVWLTYPAGFTRIAGLAVGIMVAAALAQLLRGRLGRAWRNAVAAAAAILIASLGIMLLKYGFGRLWPETWIHNNPSWIGGHAYGFFPFHGGEGWGSFPSGHTARMTAPCAVLWQRLPRLRPVWLLPPPLVAAGLIGADFHFLGDCVAGAYLGVASGALAMRIIR